MPLQALIRYPKNQRFLIKQLIKNKLAPLNYQSSNEIRLYQKSSQLCWRKAGGKKMQLLLVQSLEELFKK